MKNIAYLAAEAKLSLSVTKSKKYVVRRRLIFRRIRLSV